MSVFFLKNSFTFFQNKIQTHLAHVVFQDLPPACHVNFISIVLYILATLNYLQLFINAILSNESPTSNLLCPPVPSA